MGPGTASAGCKLSSLPRESDARDALVSNIIGYIMTNYLYQFKVPV